LDNILVFEEGKIISNNAQESWHPHQNARAHFRNIRDLDDSKNVRANEHGLSPFGQKYGGKPNNK
jgi:hypothetical protein